MGIALAERGLATDRRSTDSRSTDPGAIGQVDAGHADHGMAVSGGVAVCTPSSSRAADSGARVLGAAARCVAHFGVSRTTLEDVSREAGLSRATLYRLFPGGRDEILASMVSRELEGALSRIAARLDGVKDLEERIVVAMTAGAEELVGHEALGFVLQHEPELVVPHASFAQLDLLLETASSFLAPYLAARLDPEDARRVGEWVTRLVLSHVACGPVLRNAEPGGDAAGAAPGPAPRPFALHLQPLPEERVRWLVRMFVMPGLASLRAGPSGSTSQSSSRPPGVAGPT